MVYNIFSRNYVQFVLEPTGENTTKKRTKISEQPALRREYLKHQVDLGSETSSQGVWDTAESIGAI